MNAKHQGPKPANNPTPESTSDADRLRGLISEAGLSQRAAARELGVDERTMRYWCAGDHSPPAMAYRALDPQVRHRENLKRLIRSNQEVIALLESGKMTIGRGPALGDANTAAEEATRLRRKNEELSILLRVDDACQRRQAAFLAIRGQLLPHGNGAPSNQSLDAMDAADTEWRAAVAEEERIVREIRAGQR